MKIIGTSLLLENQLDKSWATMLQDEIKKEYFRKIPSILERERTIYNVYPESQDVFNAYRLTPYDKVKVVILGQDPYHQPDQAHGLAFSVKETIAQTPPSLYNIYREIEKDLDFFELNWTTDLTQWATQGVFLLNTILTVREGKPLSHEDIGWKQFTLETIKLLNCSPVPIVFMLWGNNAKQYGTYIDDKHHCVLESGHPSPMSANRGYWFGNKHFSKCNEFLAKNNQQPINWKITL